MLTACSTAELSKLQAQLPTKAQLGAKLRAALPRATGVARHQSWFASQLQPDFFADREHFSPTTASKISAAQHEESRQIVESACLLEAWRQAQRARIDYAELRGNMQRRWDVLEGLHRTVRASRVKMKNSSQATQQQRLVELINVLFSSIDDLPKSVRDDFANGESLTESNEYVKALLAMDVCDAQTLCRIGKMVQFLRNRPELGADVNRALFNKFASFVKYEPVPGFDRLVVKALPTGWGEPNGPMCLAHMGRFAKAAYKSDEELLTGGYRLPPGWSVHRCYDVPVKGQEHRARFVVFTKGSDVVVSLRGSTGIDDLAEGARISLVNSQLYFSAVQAAILEILRTLSATRKYERVMVVGHSLGAALALKFVEANPQVEGLTVRGIGFNNLVPVTKACKEVFQNCLVEDDPVSCLLAEKRVEGDIWWRPQGVEAVPLSFKPERLTHLAFVGVTFYHDMDIHVKELEAHAAAAAAGRSASGSESSHFSSSVASAA